MTLTAQYVPTEHTAQVWPHVKDHLAAALEYSHGDYTLDHIQMFVCMGQWLLVVVTDETGIVHGAATTSFINYPTDRVGFITAIGGKLISNRETFRQLCDIMKAKGATKIQGMARPSIARLWSRYGFKERSTLVEVRI
jgi:hypothetical protein